jgi:hypothetical protein
MAVYSMLRGREQRAKSSSLSIVRSTAPQQEFRIGFKRRLSFTDHCDDFSYDTLACFMFPV